MKKKTVCALLLTVRLALLLAGCEVLPQAGGTKTVVYRVKDGEAAVREFPNSSTVRTVEIPDVCEGVPVTKIADFAAVNLESLEVVRIGKNVREIGVWAFENDQKLRAFEVDPENPYFCSEEGVLFTRDMKTLLFYPASRGLRGADDTSTYAIPEGVQTVRTKAFYKCGRLAGVSLPQSLTSLEEKAFFRCGSLKDVKLPQELDFIGKDAFGYCTGLTEIVIPKSVTQIGEYAFYNCTGLKSVRMEGRESELTLGKKWYPTNNGRNMSDLVIEWP